MTSETRRAKKFDEFFKVYGIIDWKDEIYMAKVARTFEIIKVAGHADVIFIKWSKSKII